LVILSWEVLRVIYNLFVLVILTAACGDFFKSLYWKEMLLLAAWLNVAYCLGPVMEVFLVLGGMHRQNARWFLFSTGSFIAVMSMISYSIFYDFHIESF
jgi:hypothetical protein